MHGRGGRRAGGQRHEGEHRAGDGGLGFFYDDEVVFPAGVVLARVSAGWVIRARPLPIAKASVGSAVNDATRTLGGALGVAVLGSLVSSGYRAGMDGITGPAHDSLAGALALAQRAGGEEGGQLISLAQAAFVDGMHAAVIVGAAIAVVGAVLALVALPARAVAPAAHEPEPLAA